MADADDLDVFFLAAEELADGFSLGLDGAGGGFLDQDIAILAVLEGEQHQIHGFIERHYESRHLRLGQRDGIAFANLVNPERDNTAAAAHNVAVAGATNLCVTGETAFSHGYLLFYGFGDAHCVDGICCLVGGEAYDAFHAGIDGGIQRIVRTDDIGLHCFHREELAAGHLFEGGGVKHVVDSFHRVFESALVAHVANIELNLTGNLGHTGLEVVAHIVLLFLIA